MKIQKLSLLTALVAGAVIALTPSLRAQDSKPNRPEAGQRPAPGQRGEMVKDRLAKLAEELNLTAEQKTKVEAVIKAQTESMRGLQDATPEERREKMQAARKTMDAKMKEILTAEQYTKWEKIRGQGGAAGQGRRGGPGRPGADGAAKQ